MHQISCMQKCSILTGLQFGRCIRGLNFLVKLIQISILINLEIFTICIETLILGNLLIVYAMSDYFNAKLGLFLFQASFAMTMDRANKSLISF